MSVQCFIYKVDESVMVNFTKKLIFVNGKTKGQAFAKIPLYINDLMMHNNI